MLTPVFNGQRYLADCIESVLAQDYADFSYYIVNNCSTDDTLQIAQSYARRDSRIQVTTNASFVSAIANHNIAVGMVPPGCQYGKVVSADDQIMPDCLGKLVRLADNHPSVGVVGCYQRSGESVKWRGVPPDVNVMSGREAARLGLLGGIHVLGTPTSVLYRADVLRERANFYPHERSHADGSACYEVFERWDFGFVHEVLAVERVHAEQWSARMDDVDAGSIGYLDVLMTYGPRFLDADEFAARRTDVFDGYYRSLGGNVWKLRGRDYWRFQRAGLADLGVDFEWGRVAAAAWKEALSEARDPVTATRKVFAAIRRALPGHKRTRQGDPTLARDKWNRRRPTDHLP